MGSDNKRTVRKTQSEANAPKTVFVLLIILPLIIVTFFLIWYATSVKNNRLVKDSGNSNSQKYVNVDNNQDDFSDGSYSAASESANNQNNSTIQNAMSSQEKFILAFVEKYNAKSTLKIANLVSVDIEDKTSLYYRDTNKAA